MREEDIFINRELSWLEFNRRVLDLSQDENVPLGERLKFAAIYHSNLDEFFMVRVGSLYDQTLLKVDKRENKTQMTPAQQLQAIMPKVVSLQKVVDKNVAKLYVQMQEQGFEKVVFSKLSKAQLNQWKKYFMRELLPVLSPQIVDRRHPFPFLRDREVYVGILLKEKKNDENTTFALIPVSSQFERLHLRHEEDKTSYALVGELIMQYAGMAFEKSIIVEKCLFRVTRNADINVEEGMFDHDIDYRVVMRELLKKRRKLAAVRLQIFGNESQNIVNILLDKLMLPKEQCMPQTAPLDLSFMYKLSACLRTKNNPKLFYSLMKPVPGIHSELLYEEVHKQDVLLSFPYHSMRPFIRMLYNAARDPDVISIKMTLYRLATDSKVVEALVAAAENGKEVVTIVELRARFDEQNNIDWSHQLEQAGCTVIYGFNDYKVHSKLTLITRRNDTRYEYITAIGTGNYNEKTSELYTDFTYVTADTAIGEEVASVFNNMAVERLSEYGKQLIVAPLRFKSVLLQEVREEMLYHAQTGQGKIILKCNSISDKKVIETLSEASIAGIKVEMIVRGICCLQVGVPGLTDNITVRSLVGRYLEHARIYCFGEGERARVYIASGDFLTRNTERRVEVGIRIEDARIKSMLQEILHMQLKDNVNASIMQTDGSYTKIKPKKNDEKVNSQVEMYAYLKQIYDASNDERMHDTKSDTEKSSNGLFARIRQLFFS